jgi:hypothetical protein
MISNYVSLADQKRGVVGYTDSIGKCRACGRPTNVVFTTMFGNALLCGVECIQPFEETKLAARGESGYIAPNGSIWVKKPEAK